MSAKAGGEHNWRSWQGVVFILVLLLATALTASAAFASLSSSGAGAATSTGTGTGTGTGTASQPLQNSDQLRWPLTRGNWGDHIKLRVKQRAKQHAKQSGAPLQGTPTPTATPQPCTGWSVVSSPSVGSGDNFLFGVDAVAANDIWTAGFYVNNSNIAQTLIERWDGSTWSVIPSPNIDVGDNILFTVSAVAANDVWALGFYVDSANRAHGLALRWNGTTWTQVPMPDAGPEVNIILGSTAVAANDIWAVGFYVDTANVARTLTMRWNGTNWSVVSSPNVGSFDNFLEDVAAADANDVWAVGERCFDSTCTASFTLTMRWNGSTWNVVFSPSDGLFSNFLLGVDARAAQGAWAVGLSCTTADCSQARSLIMRWDGYKWTIVPSPNPGTVVTVFFDVAIVAANDAWAVGSFTNNGAIWGNPTSHWDGTSWTYVPVPNPGSIDNDLRDLTVVAPNDIWAVGDQDSGTGERTQIQHYTGPCSITPTVLPTRTPTRTPTATPTHCPVEFTDVRQDNPFYSSIRCLACRGILSGYSDTQNCPPSIGGPPCFRWENNVTRGQLSKIVSEAARFTEDPGQQRFRDVPATNPFYVWIQRLANRNIISGYSDAANCPASVGGPPCFRWEREATRGQIAKIVSETAGFQEPTGQRRFNDVPPQNPFYVWIQRLANRNIISGYTDPTNCPQEVGGPPCFRWERNATRGQTTRFVANTFYPDCQTPLRR